jgi:hypothetical protein
MRNKSGISARPLDCGKVGRVETVTVLQLVGLQSLNQRGVVPAAALTIEVVHRSIDHPLRRS